MRSLRIFNHTLDLLPVHVAGQFVGLWVQCNVSESADRHETLFFYQCCALRLSGLQDGLCGFYIVRPTKTKTIANDARHRLTLLLPDVVIIIDRLLTKIIRQWPVVSRHGVIRGALKYGQMLRLLCNYRDGLDRR